MTLMLFEFRFCRFCVVLLATVSPLAWSAGTDLFVCTDASGVRTYQNTDAGQGCVLLNLNPITVVPSAKERRPQVNRSSELGDPRQEQRINNSRARASGTFDASADRVKILENELRTEERKLSSLKEEFKDGQPDRQGNERNYQKYLDRTSRLEQDIRSTEENIDILKREINKLSR